MSVLRYEAGILREQWDDAARVYTRWDAAGLLIEQRPYISTENARADVDVASTTVLTNGDGLVAKAQAAIDANATFLALVSPTNAQIVAQVQRLTRECTAVIRLLIRALATTDGT